MSLAALRARATRQEQLVRKLGMDPFVGTGQVAEIIGIVKTNVSRLRASGEIPEPLFETPGGPQWLRARIEAIAEERRQSKGGS
ncbi:MAG: hypothetical protein LC798_13135 [Chloroflexi bacterium]|nr:hypothetical protein [Chloroflexota bacterium]